MAEIVESIEQFALSRKTTPKTQFSRIGVIGLGQMGLDITRILACKGMEVVFIEQNEKKISSFIKAIENDLTKTIDRWGMTNSEKTAIMNRIKGTAAWEELKFCDMVMEAMDPLSSRKLDVERRKEIYKEIERNTSHKTIIATNATALTATELISDLDHPERGISFHFLSPVAEVPIVEVVRGIYTSDEVYESVIKFAKLIGKEVVPALDLAGKISTRLIIPLINEACEILMEGASSQKDIDKTMKIGYQMSYGPFEMADIIGLDNLMFWMDNLYDEFGLLKYKASPLIKKLVRANCLGKKTNKGFYEYDKEGRII